MPDPILDYKLNNSFGLECVVSEYYKILSIKELGEFLLKNKKHSKMSNKRSNKPDLCLIGEASNVILPPKWKVQCLNVVLRGIEVFPLSGQGYKLRVAAGENWHQLVKYCVDNAIYGIENLALIPGSVGAAPIQNIGAYGVEIKDVLESVEVVEIETASSYIIGTEECGFGYRTSKFKQEWKDKFIISHINLRLSGKEEIKLSYDRLKEAEPKTPKDVFESVVAIRKRTLPDPNSQGNVGSFFHNPVISQEHWEKVRRSLNIKGYSLGSGQYRIAAASLLEELGFRGASLGTSGTSVYRSGVRMSDQHALCMVNAGQAKQEEVLSLASEIQDKVYQKTKIRLEIEPRIYS